MDYKKLEELFPNKRIGNYVWNDKAIIGRGRFSIIYLGHP
jgi:hypothetical protein